MLEQVLYQPRIEQEVQQDYRTTDLERLSVIVFYTGDIRIPGPAGLYSGKFDSFGRQVHDGLSGFGKSFENIKISPIRVGTSLPGGLEISKKSTRNTLILKESLGSGFYDIYHFHLTGEPKITLDLKGLSDPIQILKKHK